jgi:orotate phosphoribosyltransferase
VDQQQVLEVLGSVNAVITGSHIVYASFKHGDAYVNKDAVYPHTFSTSDLCLEIARRFQGHGVEVVVAPAVGGVILSQWVAYHLTGLRDRTEPGALCIYAEKETVPLVDDPEGRGRRCFAETGEFVIKRGYDKLVSGKRVLVVEDVLTTGTSARKVVDAVKKLGGIVVGVAALCNRGQITPTMLDAPELNALVDVKLAAHEEAECPLCRQDVPINTDVGRGREYLARKAAAQKA